MPRTIIMPEREEEDTSNYTVYTTIQGDMWDSIAYKVYGDETKIEVLMEANREYKETYVFPGGIKINVPDISEDAEYDLSDVTPIWR